MDSGGGTIKHRVFRDVKSGKVSIKNAEHFAAHADAILNGIKSLYISIDEVLKEPEDIEKSSPRIDGTLESIKLLVLSPLMVPVSWNSLKQRWRTTISCTILQDGWGSRCLCSR